MKILIADDDAMQRELLAGFLEKQGYAVCTAADGLRRWQCFVKNPSRWRCSIIECRA
ncbi:response regulator [Chromatium okenii]|uniref:response regulator n=1 Tax=Chromatium okenii TaxID=61644 RepID=UPI001558B769|nr:response regulator [Chromatium okenii]